ncbi:MAG: L,D-transpeptidase [Xanthobacteraceae bacterium]
MLKFAGAAAPDSVGDILRAALAPGVALSLLACLAGSADAASRRSFFYGPYGWSGYYGYPRDVPARRARVAPTRRERAEPKKDKEASFGELPKGPLQIVVSIDDQTVTLFSNGVRVARGPVSTGVPGHPTPTGVFSIIEKDRYHRSNLYSAAPMPYMQRITWSGVALHEGVLPGHPASHGCIRMSGDFAQKLWPITRLGARVIVARRNLAPVDFEHQKLFVPKPKPEEPQVAANAATDGRSPEGSIIVAQAATGDAASDAPRTLPDTSAGTSTDRDADGGANTPAGTANAVGVGDASTRVQRPDRPEPKLETTDKETTSQAADAERLQPAAEPGDSDAGKPAPTIDPPKPLVPRLRAVDQPVKRRGQVAVFVSRKEMKIFVRQGFVPLFDMPVVIDEPDRPLGTHVFTAMASTDGGAGMRWNLMTVPDDDPSPLPEPRDARRKSREAAKSVVHLKAPSTAAQALDRIQMPKEAVDRISELLIPGSSLVISDEGLGRETGRYTEFIVLTR